MSPKQLSCARGSAGAQATKRISKSTRQATGDSHLAMRFFKIAIFAQTHSYGWSLTNGAYSLQRTVGNGYFCRLDLDRVATVITWLVRASFSAIQFIARAVQITTAGTPQGSYHLERCTMRRRLRISTASTLRPPQQPRYYDAAQGADSAYVECPMGLSNTIDKSKSWHPADFGRSASARRTTNRFRARHWDQCLVTRNPGRCIRRLSHRPNVRPRLWGVPFTALVHSSGRERTPAQLRPPALLRQRPTFPGHSERHQKMCDGIADAIFLRYRRRHLEREFLHADHYQQPALQPGVGALS